MNSDEGFCVSLVFVSFWEKVLSLKLYFSLFFSQKALLNINTICYVLSHTDPIRTWKVRIQIVPP